MKTEAISLRTIRLTFPFPDISISLRLIIPDNTL